MAWRTRTGLSGREASIFSLRFESGRPNRGAGKAGDFVGGVHGIVAADDEEKSDVVRLQNVEYAVPVVGVFLSEFVAACPDGAGC